MQIGIIHAVAAVARQHAFCRHALFDGDGPAALVGGDYPNWRRFNDLRLALGCLFCLSTKRCKSLILLIKKLRDIAERHSLINKSLSNATREQEGQGAAAHFLVMLHMGYQRSTASRYISICKACR